MRCFGGQGDTQQCHFLLRNPAAVAVGVCFLNTSNKKCSYCKREYAVNVDNFKLVTIANIEDGARAYSVHGQVNP